MCELWAIRDNCGRNSKTRRNCGCNKRWNTAQCDDYSGRVWDPDTSRSEKTEAPEEPSAPVTYVLNGSSFRFHRPDCEMTSKISAKNRVDFTGTREEAIELGYDPCGVCRP